MSANEPATGAISGPRPDSWRSGVLDWGQIDEPGCYLHLPSGLLARVFAREDSPARRESSARGGVAVRLSSDPHTPLDRLREIAVSNALPVAF